MTFSTPTGFPRLKLRFARESGQAFAAAAEWLSGCFNGRKILLQAGRQE